jgi:endonuclease/exonuclease/phosphatase family metal-dependent hydrolase
MFHGEISLDVAQGLKVLRDRIRSAEIPPSSLDESFNMATWNIRELGKVRRTEAAIHYMAEIINQFDIVGIVELRDDLTDLGKVLTILGRSWGAVYSDMTPDAGGNRERVAYVFDKRAVTFNGLAAEASPPRKKQGTEYLPETSWWRSPYLASFKSGNFDFVLFTTHVRWGESIAARQKEIEGLANWLDAKRNEPHCEDKDILVIGDFNIASRDDSLFKAITSKGLSIPDALLKLQFGSNLEKNKRYDQILHSPIYDKNFTNQGGVLDFYAGDHTPLFPELSKQEFTYQLSDHLPLWIQVNTDIEGFNLDQIIQRKLAKP